MSRRALAASLLASAVVGGLAPLVGTASAATCVAFGDARGDSSYTPDGSTKADSDDDLDITGAAFGVADGKVTIRIGVVKLGTKPAKHTGDDFEANFTVNGKEIRTYAFRYDPAQIGTAHDVAYNNTGIYVDDAYKSTTPVNATYDTATNTVTTTVTVTELEKLVGAIGSSSARALSVTANAAESRFSFVYDTATADDTVAADLGSTCTVPTTFPGVVPPAAIVDAALPAPAGCTDLSDGKSDGRIVLTSAQGQTVGTNNEQTLDITGVAFRTTPRALAAYVTVDKLATTTQVGNGPRFEWYFTLNGKKISVYSQKPDAAINTALSKVLNYGGTEGGTVADSEDPRLKVSTAWDTTRNIVRLAVSTASLEAVTGKPVNGATLTALTVSSEVLTPYGFEFADDAPNTATTYAVGSGKCFGPPAATLLNVGAKTVQYTDAAPVAAKLTDADGHALAGRTVTFAIGAARTTARTGSDGVARASLNPGAVAGTYSLVASFAGDSDAGPAELPTSFTVVAEKTALTLSVVKSGSNRTVTAKLLDDDGKPVVGQTIAWFVNGSQVSTGTTNSAGLVTFKTAKPTQTVKATFAGVAGKFLAATSQQRV